MMSAGGVRPEVSGTLLTDAIDPNPISSVQSSLMNHLFCDPD